MNIDGWSISSRCLRRRLDIGPTSTRYPPDAIPASYTALYSPDAYADGWISVRCWPDIPPTPSQRAILPDIHPTLTPTAGYRSAVGLTSTNAIPANYTARYSPDAYVDGWISVRRRPENTEYLCDPSQAPQHPTRAEYLCKPMQRSLLVSNQSTLTRQACMSE